jgi:hypothetical protein
MSAHTFQYEVTHDGRVFSVDSNWRGYGVRELSQSLNASGYQSVRVVVNGKRVRYAVHALVARTHLGPQPAPGYEVRHLDGNKLNNDFRNLAWGTSKENADDRERHGRTSRGESHSAAVKDKLPLPHNKGKTLSVGHRQKISAAMKGKPWSAARRAANAI